jgi:hypothetical protein
MELKRHLQIAVLNDHPEKANAGTFTVKFGQERKFLKGMMNGRNLRLRVRISTVFIRKRTPLIVINGLILLY